jgi:hypothetical protein
MRRWLRIGLIAIVLSATVSTSWSCYGSFELTRGLHSWNGEVTDNRFVNWLVFVGLVVVPVYSAALLVDGFVFNTVEFWTGDNPLGARTLAIHEGPDGTITATAGDRSLELRPHHGGEISILSEGSVVGRALMRADGSITLYDADGDLLRHIDASVFEARRAHLAR